MSSTRREAPVEAIPGSSTLAMKLLLATLGMFFFASLLFYIVLRWQAKNWPPPDAPSLPLALWLSTFLLIGSSMTMHYALHSARLDRRTGLRQGLLLTFLLGLAFLGCQIFAWLPLVTAHVSAQANLFMLAFIMLACLHGAHVIGGLIPLGVITAAASRGAYSAQAHLPVQHVAMYWHFLDIVWLIIFVVLQLLG